MARKTLGDFVDIEPIRFFLCFGQCGFIEIDRKKLWLVLGFDTDSCFDIHSRKVFASLNATELTTEGAGE
jgi:hypothetical protein